MFTFLSKQYKIYLDQRKQYFLLKFDRCKHLERDFGIYANLILVFYNFVPSDCDN